MIIPIRKLPILEWNEITIKDLHNNFEDIWRAFESHVYPTPGGSDTHVQYNDNDTFGGDSAFTYDKSGNLTLGTSVDVGTSFKIGTDIMMQRGSTESIRVGYLAAPSMTASGLRDTIMGAYAAYTLTSGNDNSIYGHNAGAAITVTSESSCFGKSAGSGRSGGGICAFGAYSLITSSSASSTSAFGAYAGYYDNGQNSCYFGYNAGRYQRGGDYNALFGAYTGMTSCYQSYICSFGYRAGYHNTGALNLYMGATAGWNQGSGTNNTMVGPSAGSATSLRNISYSVFLGNYAGGQETNSYRLYIDVSNTTTPLIYGEFENDLIKIHGRLIVASSVADALTVGNGTAGVDYQIVIDGETNDFLATWMEDEDYLQFSDDIMFPDNEAVKFGTGVDMDIYYDGTDAWIHTDLVAASDLNIDCGTDKTIELQESVWEDVQFPISDGRLPVASYPDWATLTTNTAEFQFDIDEYIDLRSNELNHGWKEGTTGNFHLHISIPDANSTGSSRYAKFTLYVAYVNSSSIWTETSLTAEKEIPDGSSALENFYLDMGDVSFSGLQIETQVKLRIKRIAATGGTEYGSDVFIHQVGAHLEQNTLGSRQENIK
jgi:hypothetical protein